MKVIPDTIRKLNYSIGVKIILLSEKNTSNPPLLWNSNDWRP